MILVLCKTPLLYLCEISRDKHSIIKPHLSDEVFILPLLRSGTQWQGDLYWCDRRKSNKSHRTDESGTKKGLYLLVISNVWDQAHQSSELHKSSESEITYTRYSRWTCSRRDFSLSFKMTKPPHPSFWWKSESSLSISTARISQKYSIENSKHHHNQISHLFKSNFVQFLTKYDEIRSICTRKFFHSYLSWYCFSATPRIYGPNDLLKTHKLQKKISVPKKKSEDKKSKFRSIKSTQHPSLSS